MNVNIFNVKFYFDSKHELGTSLEDALEALIGLTTYFIAITLRIGMSGVVAVVRR